MMSSIKQSLGKDGFVVIPSVLTQEQLDTLRAACHTVADLARSGGWPYIRTLPKQFPPWPSDPSNGIWGLQHLLHPDMPSRETFAASYFADLIVNAVEEIIGCSEEQLVMELYNLLVRPDSDFELRWHRDDVSADATTEEEEARLNAHSSEREHNHAQWNLALYEDSSLVLIPGSHRRARTERERYAAPYHDSLPDMKVVALNAGDVAFYDNNIMHRGVYDSKVERMTLHGSMGRKGKTEQRARNVLQHGVGTWIESCHFNELDEKLKERAEGMRSRLIAMGSGEGLGYSHDD